MSNNCLIHKLYERGFIFQITDEKKLIEKITQAPINVYCGFDPTDDSLHLGHLVPILCLKHFQLSGHCPIIVIGGATGLIGDPSMKLKERQLNAISIVQIWIEKIKNQIMNLLDFKCGHNSAMIINNYDWFNTMYILPFLRDIGKHFFINRMINKEMVKQRLLGKNIGISFTEFSYNLLQSYDFAYLYKKYNVILQIGGSDQWGNITSGINLVYRLYQKIVYGLTIPLMVKSDGVKFGKTESGTIWLNPNKTSPYKFYQFWINTDDSDVYTFLKLFTFLDIEKIKQLESSYYKNNLLRIPQYILAEEITRIVHGITGLKLAKRITNSLFSNNCEQLTNDDFMNLIKDGISKIVLKHNIDLQQALVKAKLASSRKQARIMIIAKAISINGKIQSSIQYVLTDIDKLYSHYTLLRRGKKHHCLIYWE